MILEAPVKGQKFLAPEVVQTSAMDCGPAALKCLLEGFGIPVSYGRLREACQTNVDGTSINTIEDVANQLGLEAEQIMLPADHLILPESQALPALVVVRHPNGFTHFLVLWSQVGPFLQIMDPATGRRWVTWKRFQNELFIHTFPVPADAWREWAGSSGMQAPLRRRLLDLQIHEGDFHRWIETATQDHGWFSLAALDAAARMVTALVQAGGIARGTQATHVLENFFQRTLDQRIAPSISDIMPGTGPALPTERRSDIPAPYWSVLPLLESPPPHPPFSGEGEEEDSLLKRGSVTEPAEADRLLLRGAVLVRVVGRRPGDLLARIDEQAPEGGARLPTELAAALKEPAYRPEREIWKALRADGLLTPSLLSLAVLLATLSVTIEALLFQGLLQIGQNLSLVSQRVGAMALVLLFLVGSFMLEFPISATLLRMGRHLETRLRIAFLEKIPRLNDRYFHSRLTSDMTQRAHDLRQLRTLPNLGISLLRISAQMIMTTIGVIWLEPISAPLAILGTFFFVGLSLLSRPLLEERDLRLRTHTGGLSRFYLDGLLGLIPARTHGAERAMRRQHESLLVDWVRAGREFYYVTIAAQAFGSLLYSAFAALIVINYIARGGQANEILLLFYWTLNLPALGQSLADLIQQYPMQRNRILRLLEPLSAPDDDEPLSSTPGPAEAETTGVGVATALRSNQQDVHFPAAEPVEAEPSKAGVDIQYQQVSVLAGGNTILQDIDLHIRPGEHIAIVGPSGAGKSSLVGLLLGWHRPASGVLLVDGEPLQAASLHALRQRTAWVDPAVQLWNRSLYENLTYGASNHTGQPIGGVIEAADLFAVLDKLPSGLKTPLGEGGGLVSGGEGQRVRLGRAMNRQSASLVILDEPFRGLDRQKLRHLLARSRQHWPNATLLCVTHDVSETQAFPRVLVIENGHIIEDAAPAELAADPTSRYRTLLDAEEAVRVGLWSSAEWRRIWLENGGLREQPKSPVSATTAPLSDEVEKKG